MERLLLFVACIYYMALYVTAIPVYSGENTSLDDIYDMCNSEAVNRVISDSSDKLSDFLLSVRNRKDVNDILFALSRSEKNENARTFGKDNQPRDVFNSINGLRRACIIEYISRSRARDNMKKDAAQYDALDSDNFADFRGKALLNADPRRFGAPLKRDRAIGLNPTGWRKRRSESTRDTEDITKFLRNMRELLEKRERLSFNPTGW